MGDKTILTASSLFAGAGGLCIGFKNSGVKILWANDHDKSACATYRLHSPTTEVVCGDITKISADTVPDCDLILGGPPCQGFSIGGNRNEADPRNRLYKEYIRILRAKQPMACVFENVKGLLTMSGGAVIKQILSDFSEAGYDVFYELVNACNYGVPQSRERVILVGFRKDLGIEAFKLPEYTGPKMSIGDALKDIPLPAPEDVYQASYSPWYLMRNRRKEFKDVSHAILAMARQIPIWPGSPAMVKIHKDKWEFGTGGETRRFSWQEAAAIQTFPRDMEFCGNLLNKYKQIGNAVPVKLAEHIAKSVQSILQ